MERRDIALINPKYLTSAVEAKQYPCEERPEIAFLGRSNVGKSSLINSYAISAAWLRSAERRGRHGP